MNTCVLCSFTFRDEHHFMDRCFCNDENSIELRKKEYHRAYSRLHEKTRPSRKGKRNDEKLVYYHTIARPVVLALYPTIGKEKAKKRYETIGKSRSAHTYIYTAWAKKMRKCLIPPVEPVEPTQPENLEVDILV